MKTNILLLAFALFIFIAPISAQKIQGIATYKTDRKVDLEIGGEGMSDEMTKSIQAQLRKQFQKEFTLTFNENESLYEEVESLDTPNPIANGGMSIRISGGSEIQYRNTNKNKIAIGTEIMGKEFLIKDEPEKWDWKLEKETKNIGNYTCFKATYTREIDFSQYDSATDSLVETKKEITTTAWYTLDIPLQHGPDRFWGLPGLILELNDGDQTILCSKIVLNPEKGINIEAPKKGKVVNQDEFDEIQEKKSQEMMEQFKGRGRKGDSNSFQIRIGG